MADRLTSDIGGLLAGDVPREEEIGGNGKAIGGVIKGIAKGVA